MQHNSARLCFCIQHRSKSISGVEEWWYRLSACLKKGFPWSLLQPLVVPPSQSFECSSPVQAVVDCKKRCPFVFCIQHRSKNFTASKNDVIVLIQALRRADGDTQASRFFAVVTLATSCDSPFAFFRTLKFDTCQCILQMTALVCAPYEA